MTAFLVEVCFITESIFSSFFFFHIKERFTSGWSYQKNRINSAITFYGVYLWHVYLLMSTYIRMSACLCLRISGKHGCSFFFFAEECNEHSLRCIARDNNYDYNICNAITDGYTLACIAGSVYLEISRRSSRRRSETSTRIHGTSRVYCTHSWLSRYKIRPRFIACTLDCSWKIREIVLVF